MKLKKLWNKGIRSYRCRIFSAIWLMEQCRGGTLCLFLSGLFFLCFRLARITDIFTYALTGGMLLLVSFFFSLYRSWKSLPAAGTLFAYMASLLPGGGTVLSALETGSSETAFPPLPPLPKMRFLKWRRDILLLFTGAFFCAGALAFPIENESLLTSVPKLDLKDEEEKLTRALASMKKASPESEKQASQLEKELEEAVKNADPKSPGRTYELLRELDRRIQEELTRESRNQGELLRQMETLQQAARALSSGAAKGESQKEFSQLLQNLAQKNPALAGSLKKGGFDGGILGKQELQKLASSLKADAESLKRSLENMNSFSENSSESSSGSSPADAKKELEEFLKENVPGCDDLIESLTNRDNNSASGEPMGNPEGSSGGSGEGAPSRGGGDAPLEFSGVTPDYGARLVDRKAAPRTFGDKEKSQLLGSFTSDGETKEEKYTVKKGSLGTDGASAARQDSVVYPAHRRAVRKYFERKKP